MKRRGVWAALTGLAAGLITVLSSVPASAAVACAVEYTTNDWGGSGFTGNVKITNSGDPWTNWTLGFTFPGNQRVTQGWSAEWSQNGAAVTARNMPWNGSVGTGQSISIGFNGSFSGTNGKPTSFTINGVTCNGGGPVNQAPTVSLTSPTAGQTFTAPATVSLAATAADSDGTVAKVDFYNGSTLLGSDTSSPYTYSWTNVAAGSYSLTARATDNAGAVTTSSPVGITVSGTQTSSIVVSPTTLVVPEGGTASYSVRLSRAPTSNVTVATTKASGGDADLTIRTGGSLTFTPANWNTAQTVTIQAAEDTDETGGTATFNSAASGWTSGSLVATEVDNDGSGGDNEYITRFTTMYNKLKDPANGYYSPQGVPYHSVETFLVEAPDHGHETTSEAFSYMLWLEAVYGQVTGTWTRFNDAWGIMERYIIPATADQPTNSYYSPSSPATYAGEWDDISQYPSDLDGNVSVGVDPIANELQSAYGTRDIYGMHWLLDVDNVYGFGRCGDGTTKPAYINTYQRGPEESVFETIPQPSCDNFAFGGPNGYLDLFTGDASYAKQWKYTNAPDADARAVQVAYWAHTWASAQGKASQVAATVAKAAKMGDYLRYAMYDKYFKKQGCTSTSCAAGTGKDSSAYLLSWYYAWGGALDTSAGWAWRIGSSHNHQGYQNPMAAWALSNVDVLKPKGATAVTDWSTSLTRQIEFYRWLQSAEGGIAGGATNSWQGHYAAPPSGTPTFYGMAYDWQPVYHDPPSNQWFGFQAWSMERVAEYYHVTGNASAKAVLDKWVAWAMANTTINADGTYQIPSTLRWTGQPNTWNPSNPAANTNLHVTVVDHTTDVGVAGSYAKVLMYYAAKAGNTQAQTMAKAILDGVWKFQDSKGVSVPETKADYNRIDDPVYVPPGWTGEMPNGDAINSNSTFISIRSFLRDDPDWPKVQAYLNGTGPAPTFNYHRYWAQVDVAVALAEYGRLFP
ncbi:glycoside hydrolase family 48 protein [Sphaerisporangium sp. TRM90804]|uniref:glycoside hydrolase family 48 protein n=1 Tax=Sphaerisporangium sp. TRM90804 TaxID=3031113 RepID=UPI002446E0AC|nr:glycoside hydrolase family 48 protein [Sphaerisporangium sp. TRM90804]MDH2428058.1 glycoside hydrolase family 48 protein [Sphaerisporangium sp. TRM90804]